eukprot:gene2157-1326_t
MRLRRSYVEATPICFAMALGVLLINYVNRSATGFFPALHPVAAEDWETLLFLLVVLVPGRAVEERVSPSRFGRRLEEVAVVVYLGHGIVWLLGISSYVSFNAAILLCWMQLIAVWFVHEFGASAPVPKTRGMMKAVYLPYVGFAAALLVKPRPFPVILACIAYVKSVQIMRAEGNNGLPTTTTASVGLESGGPAAAPLPLSLSDDEDRRRRRATAEVALAKQLEQLSHASAAQAPEGVAATGFPQDTHATTS